GELRDSARVWLVRAANGARSAAATGEARSHVLAALEFARDEDLPELYELFGDVEIGGTPIIAAYVKAREQAVRQGRPENDQLRLLAKQLMVEMRSQGSVATKMSNSGLLELRAEGRSLFERATDVEARAVF